MVGITVIIPTLNERDSVQQTIQSVKTQASILDTVWVAYDFERLGAFGHAKRNTVLAHITPGRYCYTIDDDDILLPGAMEAMRTAIELYPGRWFIFEMIGGAHSHFPGMKVPVSGHEIRRGNIGTPMILWPNCEARWGTQNEESNTKWSRQVYRAGYFGDFHMACALKKELGDPVWVDTVVAEIRP